MNLKGKGYWLEWRGHDGRVFTKTTQSLHNIHKIKQSIYLLGFEVLQICEEQTGGNVALVKP